MRDVTIATAKVKKWAPFMRGGETKRWKKEGSPLSMVKMKKKRW